MKNTIEAVPVKTGNKMYYYKYTYRANCSYLQMSREPQLEFENGVMSLQLDSMQDEYIMR